VSNLIPDEFNGGISDGPEPLSRRHFVQAGLGVAGVVYVGAIAYPVYRYLMSPAEQAAALAAVTEISLEKSQLPAPGAALAFMFGISAALLIHMKDGNLVCYNSTCTHLGCTVQYQPDQNRIYCACHGGTYDVATGKNIAGPPPKPLTRYNVEVTDEAIIISRA